METTNRTSSFIPHLHSFRGFAIICIVIGHCLAGAVFFSGGKDLSPTSTLYNAVAETFGRGGTIYFALISGLLFSLVLESRGWQRFFKGKLVNVIMPYIVMSVLYTFFSWYQGWYANDAMPYPNTSAEALAGKTLVNIFNGRAMFHMWYVPVLFMIFLSTPLVAKVIATPKLHRLIAVLILLPLICSRVWPEFSFKSVIYFLGPYAAGMYMGTRYDQCIEKLSGFIFVFLIIVVITTGISIFLYYQQINTVLFVDMRESVIYLQKMSVAALVLIWFSRAEKSLPRSLDHFAKYAFPIYFIHAFGEIFFYQTLFPKYQTPPAFYELFLWGLAAGVCVLLVSLAVSMLVHKVLGKRSRMIIGA